MNPTKNEIRERLPNFRAVLVTGTIMTVIGLAGITILVFLTLPTLGPRWLLYFLTTMLFSGLALPLVHYLHKRFPKPPVATSTVLVREALLVGAYFDVILWLQLGNALNFALVIIIAAGLIAVEFLIRMREQNRFTPRSRNDE